MSGKLNKTDKKRLTENLSTKSMMTFIYDRRH